MANGKHFKRGAPDDNGGHNPINSRMPEEYICVVGSCSNTYNGYMYAEDDQWVACPDPRNVAGVPGYIGGPPGKGGAYTHDIYWANFLDPAIKLYANKMVQPRPGDVVTIMVFMKGYLKRQAVDWDASPYNALLHRDSKWVVGNPEYTTSGTNTPSAEIPETGSSSKPQITSLAPGSKTAGDGGFILTVNGSGFAQGAKVTWDRTILSTSWLSTTSLTAIVPTSAVSRRGTAHVKVVLGMSESKTKSFYINPSATDTDPEPIINHEILMRQTSANTDGVIKRPRQPDDQAEYIHNIPQRIVYGGLLYGTPQLPDVLVKLLVFNDPSDLSKYLLDGSISAKYWKNVADTKDERDMANAVAVSDEGCYFDAKLTFSTRPWAARWKKLLKSTGLQPPSINRSKIKIKRFDYVGHSDEEALYLQYGWQNDKGTLPWNDVNFSASQITAAMPRKNLTGDAYAHLWGCHQGGKMAPELAKAFKEVTACEESTFFDHILDSPDAMPLPEEGSEWKTYRR